ncbi:ras guanine nucleotide exchange factor domain-containing protein, partial [Myxozyma melibiosi]
AAATSIQFSSNGIINGITPARLVILLTLPDSLDYNLLSDVFLCYRQFITPLDLIRLLAARFKWAVNRIDDTGRKVRLRTFVVLRHWLLNYFAHDFVPSLKLRQEFVNVVNGFARYGKVRSSNGDRRLIGELKRCWIKLSCLYWELPGTYNPDFLSLSSDQCFDEVLHPGGLVGSRKLVERRSTITKQRTSRLPATLPVCDQPHDRSSPILDSLEPPSRARFKSLEQTNGSATSVPLSVPSLCSESAASSNGPLTPANVNVAEGQLWGALFRGEGSVSIPTDDQSIVNAVMPPSPAFSYIDDPGHGDPLWLSLEPAIKEKESISNLKIFKSIKRRIKKSPQHQATDDFAPRSSTSTYGRSVESNVDIPEATGVRIDILAASVVDNYRQMTSRDSESDDQGSEQDTREQEPVGLGVGNTNFSAVLHNSPERLMRPVFSAGYEEQYSQSAEFTGTLDDPNSTTGGPTSEPMADNRSMSYESINIHDPLDDASLVRFPVLSASPRFLPHSFSSTDCGSSSLRNGRRGTTSGFVGIPGIPDEMARELMKLADLPEEEPAASGEEALENTLRKLEGKESEPKEKHIEETDFSTGGDRDLMATNIERQSSADASEDADESYQGSLTGNQSVMSFPRPRGRERNAWFVDTSSVAGSVTGSSSQDNRLSVSSYAESYQSSVASLSIHLPFILKYRARELAEQFTLIDCDALAEIDWKELVELRWRQNVDAVQDWLSYVLAGDHQGVELIITRFNLMTSWVTSEILLTRELDERVHTIQKYIHVAAHSRKLQNYSTFMPITLALASPTVQRLSQTWNAVPARDMELFHELENLASPLRNFKNLRNEMEKADITKGCVPFIGLYLSDLTFNAQRPAYAEKNVGRLINLDRYLTSARVIKKLLYFVNSASAYAQRLPKNSELISRCLYISCLDDAEIDECLRLMSNP